MCFSGREVGVVGLFVGLLSVFVAEGKGLWTVFAIGFACGTYHSFDVCL